MNVQLTLAGRLAYAVFFLLYVGLAFFFSSFSPQAQIVSLWPSAGVALAGCLIFGQRFLPAILLGSLLFNTGNYFFQQGELALSVILTSGVIALGSVIQAWANYRILRRWRINILDAPSYSHVVGFIGIAFLCCLISAVVGNSALSLAQSGDASAKIYLNNMLIWWIGDFLGVILVTPLLLGVFIRQADKATWLRLLKSLSIPLFVLITTFQVAQQYIEDAVVAKTEQDFTLRSEALENTLKQHMSNYLDALNHLGTTLAQMEEVNYQVFNDASRPYLANLPGITAISWDILIGQDEVAEFEQHARMEVDPAFKIKGHPLLPTDPLVVVEYIQPLKNNNPALGYNVFSNEERKQSMLLAKATRKDTATNIIELVQSDKDKQGFLIFSPVFQQLDPQDNSVAAVESLKGFVVGVFLVSEILNTPQIAERLGYIDLYVYENDNPADRVFGRKDIMDDIAAGVGLSHLFEMGFANHRWVFNLHVGNKEVTALQIGDSLNFLIAEVLFGALAVFIVLSAFGYHERLTRLVSLRTDELKQANAELEHFAFYDALTGLPNRRLFIDRVEHTLALCQRNNSSAALLYMDLNGFKVVNDSLGHDVGDQLLIEVSRRLSRVLRDSDTLARMGGDEFTLLLPGSPGIDEVRVIANKLTDCLSEPITLSTMELKISISIGAAFYPRDGVNRVELIGAADSAMYAAKKSSRSLSFYADELNNQPALTGDTEAVE
ncbi:diguanylate cyclase domain-containing protein [Amphritea pacifica]|uniref:diguanylate cyclase domain-containing protein n=1 Tax=Amphritea pacifica TaxID=2811233 RepID=UPI0019665B96|nr:diguanylate cyclase [Amphritea pacifica]MBN1007444.1 diguanylate cyclase [Amphritea pacifica]